MPFPIDPPVEPMLARPQTEIPRGDEWLYEPKWDGFRAIVFRDGGDFHIGSRKTQPLGRYFPEVIETLRAALPKRCVVDGEIVIAGARGLDFDALLLRIHPAESRVRLLASEIPASYVAFDLLAAGDKDLRAEPFHRRTRRLHDSIRISDSCLLTPQTSDHQIAQSWFEEFEGAGLDGIVAKLRDDPYLPGERAMVKIKHQRTADCVVGGYRLSKEGNGIGSLLLGLYDDQGHLHYAGHTSSFKAPERKELLAMIKPLEGKSSFAGGRVPGGPSRWTQGKDSTWITIEPKLVCEVAFDHLQGARFRHGTRFLRWRPDKRPQDCTFDQLLPPHPFSLAEIRKLTAARPE
jgi:ATP-dependent DNA ligase